jgi:hypothetical protein
VFKPVKCQEVYFSQHTRYRFPVQLRTESSITAVCPFTEFLSALPPVIPLSERPIQTPGDREQEHIFKRLAWNQLIAGHQPSTLTSLVDLPKEHEPYCDLSPYINTWLSGVNDQIALGGATVNLATLVNTTSPNTFVHHFF